MHKWIIRYKHMKMIVIMKRLVGQRRVKIDFASNCSKLLHSTIFYLSNSLSGDPKPVGKRVGVTITILNCKSNTTFSSFH